MDPKARRKTRLQRECDVSPSPAVLLAAACAVFSIGLLARAGEAAPTSDRVAERSVSQRSPAK